MIPKNTSKIVMYLLRNTERLGFNINQIAKALNLSVGSAFKILKELEKDKYVTSQNIGNGIFYTLNMSNPEATKLCELLLLEEKRHLSGYAKLYSESLQAFDKSKLVILFGSVLTKREFNDVDVLFVADKAKEISAFCLELSKIRSKPVVPLILKKEDMVNEIKLRNEAIISIIKSGVVLKGESLFTEVIKLART